MSNLLKQEYAIQPNILFLKSKDGKPLRAIYPPWCMIYKEQFQENRSQHSMGKLDASGNRDKQKCIAHVVSMLKGMGDIDYAKKIFHLLDPIGINATPIDNRAKKAYGMYSGLSCGMVVDFDSIIKRISTIKDVSAKNPKYAMHLKDMLAYRLEQTNYIAELLVAPSFASKYQLDLLEKLKDRFNLNQQQSKHLEGIIRTSINKSIVNLKNYVANATNYIESGKFLFPRDPEAIRKACYEYPEKALQRAEMRAKNTNLSNAQLAEETIIDCINQFNKAMFVPSPTATVDTFKESGWICEEEAQEISKGFIESGKNENVSDAGEIATYYDSFQEISSGAEQDID